MATKRQIEDTMVRNYADLCKLAETLGYGGNWGQLQCSNGSHVSSLLDFFDDNPGVMEVIVEWMAENHGTDDDEDEDDSADVG